MFISQSIACAECGNAAHDDTGFTRYDASGKVVEFICEACALEEMRQENNNRLALEAS